jgi:hypothetical protein
VEIKKNSKKVKEDTTCRVTVTSDMATQHMSGRAVNQGERGKRTKVKGNEK